MLARVQEQAQALEPERAQALEPALVLLLARARARCRAIFCRNR